MIKEENLSVAKLLSFIKSGEAALTGTAVVIAPVGEFIVDGRTHTVQGKGENVDLLRSALTAIQFGSAQDRYGWLSDSEASE